MGEVAKMFNVSKRSYSSPRVHADLLQTVEQRRPRRYVGARCEREVVRGGTQHAVASSPLPLASTPIHH
jgi:hypothetical protein